jgi:hypothetical protein
MLTLLPPLKRKDSNNRASTEPGAVHTDARHDECVFCSADGAALEGAGILRLAQRCTSLEDLLQDKGIKKQLDHKYSRAFAELHKKRGTEIRLYRM